MVGPGWDGEDEPGVGLGQAKNGAGTAALRAR